MENTTAVTETKIQFTKRCMSHLMNGGEFFYCGVEISEINFHAQDNETIDIVLNEGWVTVQKSEIKFN